jgi:hypothetical protein
MYRVTYVPAPNPRPMPGHPVVIWVPVLVLVPTTTIPVQAPVVAGEPGSAENPLLLSDDDEDAS